jgi:deoxyribose-phosphate aldolase
VTGDKVTEGQGSGRIENIAGFIDHTLLKQDATQAQIVQLCAEARAYQFASVCVNPVHVALCGQLLRGSGVDVCTVIGFPLGATITAVKVFETCEVIDLGAAEVDMVIDIGALKSQNYAAVVGDITAVTEAAHSKQALVKVIIETALLTDEEKVIACQLAQAAGADFVKTSTGFSSAGATAEDVALMRRTVGPEMGVKAAGGVRSLSDAQAMIAAGATRIGASAGIAIVEEATS